MIMMMMMFTHRVNHSFFNYHNFLDDGNDDDDNNEMEENSFICNFFKINKIIIQQSVNVPAFIYFSLSSSLSLSSS